ncbi:MAG: AraC family transcriptional regulator [Anderseniella sp.]
MQDHIQLQRDFFTTLGTHLWAEELFDCVADTVYFLKDHAGRYMSLNQTLVERCGCSSKQDLIGRTAEDVFPEPLGAQITAQDRDVLQASAAIREKLELHLYAGGREGWCLTWKEPLRDPAGQLIGLSGISRDLQPNAGFPADIDQLSVALAHIEDNLDTPLRLPDLAEMAGLSGYQLDSRIRNLFGITAGQYITRARIDHACARLKQTDEAISMIALACGYSDQAAFSRQFRQSVGLSPAAYRKRIV